MTVGAPRPGTATRQAAAGRRGDHPGLGAALRRAWIGYQRRMDTAMAGAGFGDRGRPDGRVLRMCAGPAGTTTSHIGRELGITRQGAGKIVSGLRARGYVEVTGSPTSGREKTVRLTARAHDYLAAHRKAARSIERQLRTELGQEALDSLHRLLDILGGDEEARMSDYFLTRHSRS